jgi:hypothetical protein
MEDRLRQFTKETLMEAAKSVCKQRGIIKPDRLCVRGRVSLICFFCEHFPDFPAGFPMLPTAAGAALQHHTPAAPALPPPTPDPTSEHPLRFSELRTEQDDALPRESLWERDFDFTNFFH